MNTTFINLVHVDDMEIERVRFEKELAGFSNVQLLAAFSNAKEALDFCSANMPNLVVVDVEMPGEDGVWLAARLKELQIPFAFLTCHESHAIEAFKLNALHYIPKPVAKMELAELFRRYRTMPGINDAASAGNETSDMEPIPQRIFVNTQKQVIVVQLSEVVYISADGSYSHFHLANGTRIVSGKTMKNYAGSMLKNPDFIQIHRSYIINLAFLTAIVKKKLAITFKFHNDMKIQVATFRKGEWLSKLGY